MVTRNEALAALTAPGEDMELIDITANGRSIKAFKNAPPTLRQIYEQTASDLTFLVYEDERLTFDETWRKACALAYALVEDFGVKTGDRVAISMRNYPEWIIAFEAVTSIGAVAVAMNAMWQPHEMVFGLEDSGSKVLICDQERLDRLAAADHAPAGLQLIAARTTKPLPAGARAFDEIIAARQGAAAPDVDFGPDDDAIMLYTSGSTGNPKGVVSTHRNVISALLSWELDLKAAVATGLLPAPGGRRAADCRPAWHPPLPRHRPALCGAVVAALPAMCGLHVQVGRGQGGRTDRTRRRHRVRRPGGRHRRSGQIRPANTARICRP